MRPDEHKKKRSAQYKKKHSGKPSDEKKENVAGAASHKSSQKPDHDVRSPFACGSSGASCKDKDETKTSAGTVASCGQDKLPSNWERYEIKEDDIPTQRGSDFNFLLQGTSNAISQFRFKDEQSWIDSENSGAPASNLLSIDCNEIAAALMCLPLHKRLGIESDNFEVDQIKQFEEDADRHRRLYEKQRCADSAPDHNEADSSPVYGDVDVASLVTNLLSNTDDSDDIQMTGASSHSSQRQPTFSASSKANQSTGVSEADHGILDDILGLSDSVNCLELVVDSASKSNRPQNNIEQVLNVKSISTTQTEPCGIATVTETKQSSMEDELDFLLSMQEKSYETQKTTRPTPATNDCKTEDGSLENWLDSVIDG